MDAALALRPGMVFRKPPTEDNRFGERRRIALIHEPIYNDDGTLRCRAEVLYISFWVQSFFSATLAEFEEWARDAHLLTAEEEAADVPRSRP